MPVFPFPSEAKQLQKERIGGKTVKVYDVATSPYRQVLASNDIDFKHKASLSNLYVRLNPVILRNAIDLNVGKLC